MVLEKLRAAAIALALGPILPVAAAEGGPDWPCVQRKVSHLSPAVMWPEAAGATRPTETAAQDLADTLALRRVALDDAAARIDALAAAQPEMTADSWAGIFLGTFEKLDHRRARVIDGIGRYAKGQAALADKIETLRSQMRTAEAAETPDFDLIDKLEEEIDWSVRIFDDRRRTLTYVCDTPRLIEQRIYEIAQLLKARAGQ